ncbi:hypothetical protein Bca52824_079952 [Brassica carinata]|uniref:F-box domain-containing protein n=1 Tax=Brassica carinata TaxID=52824 RepID=A0A8X7Q2B8_BRACI|nr:hypothetical protein Bca52824_079952 [Brassica carinata]
MNEGGGGCVNWAELPPDLTSSILHRLGPIEIVKTAQKVCRSWRRVCKDPSMWRKIVIHIEEFGDRYYEKLCRHVVGRSRGGLVEIDISHFGSDPLLRYIADESSSHLRSLRISFCYQVTDKGFIAAIARLPLLEELEVSYCSLSEECLRVVGQSCPNLKTLKKNCVGYRRHPRKDSDDVALAIAETMPGLCHLQLFGDRLTDVGLNAILDRCPNLEHLDLRQCFNVELVGDLEIRCFERIKVVRRPNDSIHDYPFDAMVNNYPYGF